MKRLVFCVTDDLIYDQRMQRICNSLHQTGYKVTLLGRRNLASPKLIEQAFFQRRLFCFFSKGKFFYLEYNLRLFFHLLFMKVDLICAIDLDTILPCYLISKIRKKQRVYDAHELFCEMKEIVSRPLIYKVWKFIERKTVPRFKYGYTVCTPIQKVFKKEYNVDYELIMNMPVLQEPIQVQKKPPFILYQGAVNHGRCFETLIPAFQMIDSILWIYGHGNFYNEVQQLISNYNVEEKVFLKGRFLPDDIKTITPEALIGITLFENKGLSNYYSLANRFFDYIQAGIPQVCVNFPAYKEINDRFQIALLVDDTSPESLASAINLLLKDKVLYNKLKQNCLEARLHLNWNTQENKLVVFYEKVLSNRV